MDENEPNVPYGSCGCGCGERTPLATRNSTARGHVIGQPMPFKRGHRRGRHQPQKLERWREEDRGYTTACWIWQLSFFPNGYGQVTDGNRSKTTAHRALYQELRGPVPRDLQLDHLCRQRDCVNPDHLEPVTHLENCRRSNSTRLTEEDVREIRRLCSDGARPVEVAAQYGLTRQYVNALVRGEYW